ncbi:hypothetical protein [Nonomuraea aurantiaca]|nr:hypothetical protein [Nonomuraea aurantiaca]
MASRPQEVLDHLARLDAVRAGLDDHGDRSPFIGAFSGNGGM